MGQTKELSFDVGGTLLKVAFKEGEAKASFLKGGFDVRVPAQRVAASTQILSRFSGLNGGIVDVINEVNRV